MELDLLKLNEVFRVAVIFDESLGIKILCLASDYISCEECY
jgi:hypothetical protein